MLSPSGMAFDDIRAGAGYPLSFSSDGSRLIAVDPHRSQSRHSDAYVVDLVTGALLDLPRDPVNYPLYIDWGPDDRTLTLARTGKVHILDLTTGEMNLVLDCTTIDGGRCGPVEWSPDRQRVAVFFDIARSGPLDRRVGLYILDAECFLSPGGCPFDQWERIPGHGGLPTWSPDGRYIAIAEYSSSSLSVVDAASLATVRVTPLDLAAHVHSLAWSRQDGLALGSSDEVYLLPPDAPSPPVLLRTGPGEVGPIDWINVPP
jgi:WD40 repeat protein